MSFPKNTLFLLAAFLIAFLVLTVLVIYPLFGHIRAYSEDLFFLKNNLALLEQKTAKASESQKKFQESKSAINTIDNLFVDPETPIEFLQFLEKMAQESNLEIDISLLGSKETEVSLFSGFSFQLSLMGPSPSCFRFLEKVETAPYLIEIGDFAIRRLTTEQLESEHYQRLFLGDVALALSIKAFTSLEE